MRFDLAELAKRSGKKRRSVVLAPITARKASEAELRRIILTVIKGMQARSPMILQAAAVARDRLVADDIGLDAVLQALRSLIGPLVEAAKRMVTRLFKLESARHSRRWLQQVNASIGIDLSAVLSERDIAPSIEMAVSRNVALIKGIAEDTARRVELAILDMVTQGQTNAAMANALNKAFGFGKKRAALIARDQAAKFNAALNRIRQEQAGITQYEWFTMQDERVRGNPSGKYPNAKPSHWDRHGKRFSYAKPPEGGAPGEAINCRCIARPVLEID